MELEEALDQLDRIEKLLDEAGVPLVHTDGKPMAISSRVAYLVGRNESSERILADVYNFPANK